MYAFGDFDIQTTVVISWWFSQVDDDRVVVFLKKKEDKSWYPEMDSGLETAEEEPPGEGQE